MATDATGCPSGTHGLVNTLDAFVRVQAGAPDGVPSYVPPPDDPHVFLLADFDSLSALEVEAGVYLEQLGDVFLSQRGSGLVGELNLGTGASDLVVHGFADLVGATGLPDGVPRGQATVDVVLSPLPADVRIDAASSPDGPVPLLLTIDGDPDDVVPGIETLDVDAVVDARLEGPDELIGACGSPGTVCGEVSVADVPTHAVVTIERDKEARSDDTVDYRAFVDLASAEGSPSLDADVLLGLPFDLPIIGDRPIRIQAEIADLPHHATVALDTTQREREGEAEISIDRVRAFACHRDLTSNTCIDPTDDAEPITELPLDVIGSVELRASTFLPDADGFPARPDGFPLLHSPADQALLVAGRGPALEAFARLSRLSAVDLLPAPGAAGAQVTFGPSAGPLSDDDELVVEIDIADLALGEELMLPGGRTLLEPTLDLLASASLAPFPDEVSVCFTEPASGVALPDPLPAFLADCANHPYGPNADVLGVAASLPGGADMTLAVDVDANLEGTDPDTGGPAPAHRLFGDVTLEHVPGDVEFHLLPRVVEYELTSVREEGDDEDRLVLLPVATGPFDAILTTPGSTTAPKLTLAAGLLIGDEASCDDPRATVIAICLDATVTGLPDTLDFHYNPDQSGNNLRLHVDGDADVLQIEELRLTAVVPGLLDPGADTIPIDTDAFVLEGDVVDVPLPMTVEGRLVLPRAASDLPVVDLAVTEGLLIPQLGLHLRNFLVPDPLVDVQTPPDRLGVDAEYEVIALQRGGAFRLDAVIPAVKSIRFQPVANGAGTVLVGVGFAQGFDVRVYLDLQPSAFVEELPPSSLLVDALLEQLPSDVTICVRPPGGGSAAGAVPASWCTGDEIGDGDGAVEISHTSEELVDIDLFARLRTGAELLSARVDVDDIPAVVRARFPTSTDGTIDIATFAPDGDDPGSELDPAGVQRIRLEAATFDISGEAAGYANDAARPYDAVAGPIHAALGRPGRGARACHRRRVQPRRPPDRTDRAARYLGLVVEVLPPPGRPRRPLRRPTGRRARLPTSLHEPGGRLRVRPRRVRRRATHRQPPVARRPGGAPGRCAPAPARRPALRHPTVVPGAARHGRRVRGRRQRLALAMSPGQ